MACKGICTKYEARKTNGISRYIEGQKRIPTGTMIKYSNS